MRTQIAKWGKGLAVRIPRPLARELRWEEGKPVEISVESGRVVIVTVEDGSDYDLDALIARISDENRHEETDWGPAVGNEFP